MIKRKIEITNKIGLRARQAFLFVKTANRFLSEICLQMDNINVSGKSILGIMSLGIPSGSFITILIDGIDEEQAMEELIILMNGNTNYTPAD